MSGKENRLAYEIFKDAQRKKKTPGYFSGAK